MAVPLDMPTGRIFCDRKKKGSWFVRSCTVQDAASVLTRTKLHVDSRRSILLSSVLDIPWTCFKRPQASSDSGKLAVHGDVWKVWFGGISLVEIGDCCVVSGFRCEVAENCAVLSYYAASSGNFLPTFRDNLRSHLQRPRILLDSWNVSNKLPLLAVQ